MKNQLLLIAALALTAVGCNPSQTDPMPVSSSLTNSPQAENTTIRETERSLAVLNRVIGHPLVTEWRQTQPALDLAEFRALERLGFEGIELPFADGSGKVLIWVGQARGSQPIIEQIQ
jgi:hypothetical protein